MIFTRGLKELWDNLSTQSISPSYSGDASNMPGSLPIESDIDSDIHTLADRLSMTDISDTLDEMAVDSQFGDQDSNSDESQGYDNIPPNVHVVAHSPPHQRHFETYGIAWGVQWEIARLQTSYCNFSWDSVSIQDLQDLSGSNLEKAPAVPTLLLGKPGSPESFAEYARRERLIAPHSSVSPWSAYDSEELYIRAKSGSNFSNDQGGNIAQRIHLKVKKCPKGLEFNFVLDPPTKSKSCRFARYLGSRRLIQCRFSDSDGRAYQQEILDFFCSKKLLLNGRIFRAFYGHGSRIELAEINEDVDRKTNDIFGDHNRHPLRGLIAWHNNVERNSNQRLGKWATRFALGFSTSLPGLRFSSNDIHFIEDEYASNRTAHTAESHEIMTDGCGYLNYAALKTIQDKMSWEVFPTHIQARIAGSKGIFVLHPEHRNLADPPQIWIRSSQNKVKLADEKGTWSQFHCILDVCSGPYIQHPSSVTFEMIICLSAGGISDVTLANLLRESLKGVADDHEPPQHPWGAQVLWDLIYNAHRVSQNRVRQMISLEQQRAYGLIAFEDEEEIDSDDAISAKWDVQPDRHSGIPATAQEQVLGWLQAGFDPSDPWVIDKLVYLQKKVLDAAIEKYRITIQKSLRAHIIPDPLGVLGEGEVFFASTQIPLEDSAGVRRYCLNEPVLVSRNPCVQKSDVRKVIAVDNHQLWSLGYHDVVVFSAQGECSLASLLSGGDYDGDTVVLIWDEAITSTFTNADLSTARPAPDFGPNNFKKSKTILRDLASRSALGEFDLEPKLVEALLQGAFRNGHEGQYNMFYRNSTYLHGLGHPETVRLGHMFAQCLDSAKSGLSVRPEVFREDRKKWDKETPDCFAKKEKKSQSSSNLLTFQRDVQQSPFILDTLKDVAREETKMYMARLVKQRDERLQARVLDQDLAKPFKEAQTRAKRHGFNDELKIITDHVELYRDYYKRAKANDGPFSPKARLGKKKDGISIGDRQESVRAVSEAYNLGIPKDLAHFDDEAIRRVSASYAYMQDCRWRGGYDFCFAVAWAELCAIKARANGEQPVSLRSKFTDSMSMNKKLIKLYREIDAGSH